MGLIRASLCKDGSLCLGSEPQLYLAGRNRYWLSRKETSVVVDETGSVSIRAGALVSL